MYYEQLSLAQLTIDPTNYRGSYEGIAELAESISEHGLLQNLVVTPREGFAGRYVVLAGNRRLLAIDRLATEGRWPREEPIPCLVRDDDPWIAITENVNRHDVAPWRVGYRYQEFLDAGHTMVGVAGKLKVSLGTVSNYVNIARGLHPSIVTELERLGHRSLSRTQYLAIASCVTEDGDPIISDQRRLLKKMLDARALRATGKARKPRDGTHAEKVYMRFKTLLRGELALPPHVHGYVIPIMHYLNGDVKKPKFPPRLPGTKL